MKTSVLRGGSRFHPSLWEQAANQVERKYAATALCWADIHPRSSPIYKKFRNAFDSPRVDIPFEDRLAAADQHLHLLTLGYSNITKSGLRGWLGNMISRLFKPEEPEKPKRKTPPPRTTSMPDLIKRMSNDFATAKIPYAIGGANALNMWAEPRATLDVDVNIFLTIPELETIVPVLKQLGATTVEEVKDKFGDYVQYYDETFVPEHFLQEEMSYATVYIGGIKVELFPNTIALQQQISIDGIRMVPFEGTPGVSFLSREALIAVKLLFFRRRDQNDILNILRTGDIDWSYLDILVNILKEHATPTYDDGYGGIKALDWWPDVASEYKSRSKRQTNK